MGSKRALPREERWCPGMHWAVAEEGGGEIEWDGEASRIQAFAGLTPEARGLRRERGAGDLSSRQAEPPLSNDVPLDF